MSGSPSRGTLFEAVPALGALSAQGSGRARLIALGSGHPGFALAEGASRFGRDPGQCHHVILSSHVSRAHCEVLVEGASVRVKDLGSHNGTFVNGERVTDKELRPGDLLGLSRRVTLVLVRDDELHKPLGVMLSLEEPEVVIPAAAVPAGGTERRRLTEAVQLSQLGEESGVEAADREPDPARLIKELEQQRNLLAILYQLSLRCLSVGDHAEAEKLITNVLPRLLPLASGFLLYQSRAGWRACICPGSKERPSDQTVRACYQLALERRAPEVVESPAELASLGLSSRAGQLAALVVPLLHGEAVTGVIGAIAGRPGLYTAALVELAGPLAAISAAALRDPGRVG